MVSDIDDEILHYLPLTLPDHMSDSSTDDESNCIREMDNDLENNVASHHPVPLLTQRTSDAAGALLDMFSNPTAIESSARDCGGEPTINPTHCNTIESVAQDCVAPSRAITHCNTFESVAQDCVAPSGVITPSRAIAHCNTIESVAQDCVAPSRAPRLVILRISMSY